MHYSLLSEIDLVNAVVNRDTRAFDEIYKRHWKKLFRVARKITDGDESAQDIVQDVFISFWEKGCNTLKGQVEGYLYQSVKYKCFMHLRDGAISQKHLSRLNAIIYANITEQDYDLKELESLLEKGMAALPQKCREVFYLSRFEALSNKKIAEQLHISTKTVENQITKALRVLRMSMNKLAVLFPFFLLS